MLQLEIGIRQLDADHYRSRLRVYFWIDITDAAVPFAPGVVAQLQFDVLTDSYERYFVFIDVRIGPDRGKIRNRIQICLGSHRTLWKSLPVRDKPSNRRVEREILDDFAGFIQFLQLLVADVQIGRASCR